MADVQRGREKKERGDQQAPLTADEQVDEASEDSFPASDPPSTQPLHTGKPGKHSDHKSK